MATNDVVQVIIRLTESPGSPLENRADLIDFARRNGWRPSNIEDYPGVSDVANGHLVVEHGLDNTAVISFLKNTNPFGQLSRETLIRLLCLSYNNLVDWHFFPDKEGLNWVYNRTDPPKQGRLSVFSTPDTWSAEAFDTVVGRKPSPNVKALDDALITTISDWKRNLAADIGKRATNARLSALFNGILFTRALEDTQHWRASHGQDLLVTMWTASKGKPATLRDCICQALRELGVRKYPEPILGDVEALAVFDRLDRDTVRQFVADFYDNRYCRPYRYDFSIMSKHALSRIYEHYVSLLREKDSPQLRLFPESPDELPNKVLGGIYTPQYIARFFAKFLKENHTPPVFRALAAADPACGSGIFPRTLLEMQCDPLQDIDVKDCITTALSKLLCIDIDENACRATRLSLSLLHLVLTRDVPARLNVVHEEAVKYLQSKPEHIAAFDAVLANPPYIRYENLDVELRQRFERFLGPLATGRIDASLAQLEVGLRLVRSGGYVLYVLPHSFLLARNAAELRKRICRDFWVRLLADLSEIPVFAAGSYVVLLILQKKSDATLDAPLATMVRCREFVGHALQDALEGKICESDYYSIFRVPQSVFETDEWQIVSPKHVSVKAKLDQFQCVDAFLDIKEGFVTGADDVFIRARSDVPAEERRLYKPYLPDRAMMRYCMPRRLDKVVLYPYDGMKKLDQHQLETHFRHTWAYLVRHQKALKDRGAVSRSGNAWWCPVRPRSPEHILRPKIVSPHLTILPRFSLDGTGDILVSRSPFMFLKDATDEVARLKFFLAILNSSVIHWQMVSSSHKYARGYLMLEKKTLDSLRVPDPKTSEPQIVRRLLKLVDERLAGDETKEDAIDKLVCVLYGLNEAEAASLGAGAGDHGNNT